ncbi:MAG TPA: 50S ribosomal protein L34 [Candidatus Moranbacteria bacterium]|nr:50S ribosomal protein L34 [Candidatus Moranbacteria bacterium]HAT75116.1 50S ribosomal protein L34 [Candidatus Moranbacteria bacterium]
MSETYKPKSIKRKRSHGFMERNSAKSGQNVLKARRRKGRKKLTTV